MGASFIGPSSSKMAGDGVVRRLFCERRRYLPADRLRFPTAGGETAPGGRSEEAGRAPLRPGPFAALADAGQRRDQGLRIGMFRMREDLRGRTHFDELAGIGDRNAVGDLV